MSIERVTVCDRASSHATGWLAQILLAEEAISIDIFVIRLATQHASYF